jgi:hypothetical protein
MIEWPYTVTQPHAFHWPLTDTKMHMTTMFYGAGAIFSIIEENQLKFRLFWVFPCFLQSLETNSWTGRKCPSESPPITRHISLHATLPLEFLQYV